MKYFYLIEPFLCPLKSCLLHVHEAALYHPYSKAKHQASAHPKGQWRAPVQPGEVMRVGGEGEGRTHLRHLGESGVCVFVAYFWHAGAGCAPRS